MGDSRRRWRSDKELIIGSAYPSSQGLDGLRDANSASRVDEVWYKCDSNLARAELYENKQVSALKTNQSKKVAKWIGP